MPPLADTRYKLWNEDMRERLSKLSPDSIDSVVTDPPYNLGFMGKSWDKDSVAFQPATWEQVYRVLKPGAYMLVMGGTRTYHRLTCAIEDAGFEIRDCLMFMYGTGFPKSMDISKAIDKSVGAERKVVGKGKAGQGSLSRVSRVEQGYRENLTSCTPGDYPITAPATDAAKQWEGWGTALKPAYEPIVLCRKPLIGTVVENVLKYGTGGLNIDGCRISCAPIHTTRNTALGVMNDDSWKPKSQTFESHTNGRFPANIIHDGSEEVLETFAEYGDKGGGFGTENRAESKGRYGTFSGATKGKEVGFGDTGTAARFFYCAKASKRDREEGNSHPTVKPTALMQYLIKLITPPGGLVCDPFMGSGSTGKACAYEGMRFYGIDSDKEHGYFEIAKRRIAAAYGTKKVELVEEEVVLGQLGLFE